MEYHLVRKVMKCWTHYNMLLFCCLVTKSCPTLFDPMDCSFPVLHWLPEFAQTHVHWVSDAIQPPHPLLSPSPHALPFSSCPQLLPCQGLFHKSSLHIRWPKYWSFSFSISPSSEDSGLSSFRMDLFSFRDDWLSVIGFCSEHDVLRPQHGWTSKHHAQNRSQSECHTLCDSIDMKGPEEAGP